MNQEEVKKMEKFIKKLSKEKIDEINRIEIDNHNKQYIDFKCKFLKGDCYICNSKLSDFNENKPCIHWLLRPNGFKKKHFNLIIQRFNYSNFDSYLRWVANQEDLFKNINDLSEEKRGSMILEYTIKYKKFEWSFSCSKTDFEGHETTKFTKYPHYHFQMREEGKNFIDFSDFHIPLSDQDIYTIKVKRGEIKGIYHYDGFGMGMESFFRDISPDNILKYAKTTEDNNKSSIYTIYIIEAEPGKTISGEDITNILKERKETKTPLWNLLPKLKNVKSSKAIISPGEGVPEMSQRKRKNETTD